LIIGVKCLCQEFDDEACEHPVGELDDHASVLPDAVEDLELAWGLTAKSGSKMPA
jgi:hypothetical protein